AGQQRMAFVNIPELLAYGQIKDLFEQTGVALVQDGFLEEKDNRFSLVIRFHGQESEEPVRQETVEFGKDEIFAVLHRLIKILAETAAIELPEALAGETMEFGTENPDAFLNFLEGYDALNYVQQANGMVAREFSPQGAIDSLLEAVNQDPDFDGPYQVLVQLCRQCAGYRIGTFEMLQEALTKLTELRPDDFTAYFGLGEVYQSINDAGRASELYEKAVSLNPDDPALYSRLGMTQMQIGMPVNAERNFRKAISMEGDDKPSADLLAQVLLQTGRGHEIPPLWKAQIEANPQNGAAHAKYAIALIQAGNTEQGERAFETALETLEDNTVIKRYYAPMLAQKEEFDRAMDFYEDVLDVAPNDIAVLTEYAQTLESADREFEVPNVLKTILQSNPDPNTRANTLARLIELEQPKRVEAVENARKKMEEGDFQSALRELRPMRNWLADYWKMWFLIAAANNQLQQYVEAEEAARQTLELFPGCEPAYGELSNALTGQEKHEEAYQLMRFAAANNPGSLPLHLNLGLAAKRAGHADEARNLAKQIREALAQDPNRSQVDPILDEMER
ncbi:MAG TPA: tetratricopeptide repeat protein, partial [Fimbriimonas sp.]|nr:tetratricopeptide repeat protein [Fimbriimonas sp.]